MGYLIIVAFFTVPVFLMISSVILLIKSLRIGNAFLSVLFLINALLPVSFVATFKHTLMEDFVPLLLTANICVCAFDLIVIFILPLLSDRKLTKGIENPIIFTLWGFSLLFYVLICILLLDVSLHGLGFNRWG
jgi:hypothetical protein